jgi:hypothetical protein
MVMFVLHPLHFHSGNAADVFSISGKILILAKKTAFYLPLIDFFFADNQ